MQIVLARMDADFEVAKEGRVDLGERHTFREIQKPVSLMWTNEANDTDKARAEQYATAHGYTVFCYAAEADPLGKARNDISHSTF